MILYEHQYFGDNNLFKTFVSDHLTFPLHFHRSYEFVYVFSGEIEVIVDEKKTLLGKGNAVFVFPNQLHAYRAAPASKVFLMIFSPELVGHFFGETKGRLPENNVFSFPDFCYDSTMAKNLYLLKSFLYRICGELLENTSLIPKKESKENNYLLHKMLLYIEENYQNECNLKDLADKLKYDYAYLSKLFIVKANIGFNRYLNQYRINRACYMLKNTELPISQIAVENGYSSLRTFNRNFIKITGLTPSRYQKS